MGRQSVLLLLMLVVAAVTGFAPPKYHAIKPSGLSMASTDENKLFGSFTKQLGDVASGFFAKEEQVVVETKEEPQFPDVVIDPDYKLAAIFLAAGFVLDLVPYIQILLGLPVTLLGILFLVQTFRIRFCFDKDSFELKMGDDLEETGENIVVGGANKWTYDSFVNYDFFPEGWIDQPQGPILVYFKETQTPSENWNDGPGAKANSPEAVANGAAPGQVHFFPALCNTQQLRAEFEKRGCAKL